MITCARHCTDELCRMRSGGHAVQYQKYRCMTWLHRQSFAMFTVQEPANQLLNKLLSKGILTQEDEQFRFLFSPQLKLRLRDDQVVFFSTVNPPRNYMSSMNRIQWTYMDTDFEFQVDSLSDKRVFGSIEIPMKKILESIAFL